MRRAFTLLCVVAGTCALMQEQLMRAYQAAVDAHRVGRVDEALASYREVLEMNPSIAAVHNNVAAILLSKGEKEAAERSWRSAVELKPEYAEAHFNLAVLLSERAEADDLASAEHHCTLAMEHKRDYHQAHHLMGNILSSLRRVEDAAEYYAKADAIAGGGTSSGGGSAGGGADGRGDAASSCASDAAATSRLDGVQVGHTRRVELAGGRTVLLETLSLSPLALLARDFLTAEECDELIRLAAPKMKGSLMMGDARAAERSSTSVFLGASEHALLGELQERLASLAELPLLALRTSEDLQVVHYEPGATFGMHHDSSKFLPRFLTAFYYLNDGFEGGETAFPAAEGNLKMADAMRIDEPAKAGGLVVEPERGAALLWYNYDASGALDPAAVHAGCRVLSGEKWGANHWVRLQPPGTAASTQAAGDAREAAPEMAEDGAGGSAASAGRNAAKNRKKREKEKAKKAAAAAAEA